MTVQGKDWVLSWNGILLEEPLKFETIFDIEGQGKFTDKVGTITCDLRKLKEEEKIMGYYTNYDLQVPSGEEWLIKELRDYSDWSKRAFDHNGDTYDTTTWYDHEREISEFSKLYPDYLLKLYGEGEENSDMWIKYFKDGKVQYSKAVITYDDFDEAKLKPYHLF